MKVLIADEQNHVQIQYERHWSKQRHWTQKGLELLIWALVQGRDITLMSSLLSLTKQHVLA